ncbi:hypothetical protein BSG1_21150 [Bacillus sp. SG-1]|nr:hypothetical protein BSG1_21150 [Bacillus sp. SG-1]
MKKGSAFLDEAPEAYKNIKRRRGNLGWLKIPIKQNIEKQRLPFP